MSNLGDGIFWVCVVLVLCYYWYPAPFDCAVGVKPACEQLAKRYQ